MVSAIKPAHESPTRDPSNCTDTKFPVTHFFFLFIFQMCPGKFPSKLPVTMELLTHHFQKCLPQFPEQWRHTALCFLTDLVQTMSPLHGTLNGSMERGV